MPETVIPKMSQEALAEMIGTTRSRVSFFMNRFRGLGFLDYDGGSGLQVHSSLLNVVLHDQLPPRDPEAQFNKNSDEPIQAFAGSNPESGAIFVATSTPNNVAVLRTLPEMVMSAYEHEGMLPRQRVKAVTHVVELSNFVQNRLRMHGVHGFPASLRRENFRWADLVSENLK